MSFCWDAESMDATIYEDLVAHMRARYEDGPAMICCLNDSERWRPVVADSPVSVPADFFEDREHVDRRFEALPDNRGWCTCHRL